MELGKGIRKIRPTEHNILFPEVGESVDLFKEWKESRAVRSGN